MDHLFKMAFLSKSKLGRLFLFWTTQVLLLLLTYQFYYRFGYGIRAYPVDLSTSQIIQYVLSDAFLYFILLYLFILFAIQQITQTFPDAIATIRAKQLGRTKLLARYVTRGVLWYNANTQTYYRGVDYEDFMDDYSKKERKKDKMLTEEVGRMGIMLLVISACLIMKPFGCMKWLLIVTIPNGIALIIAVFIIHAKLEAYYECEDTLKAAPERPATLHKTPND